MCAQNQAYSYFRHLCWGLLLNHDPALTWVLVMSEFSLYLDDSGHPDDQPFVAVAGFMATEQDWIAFEPVWNSALAQHGLGDEFHMTDFMKLKMDKKKRGRILQDLTDIINKYTVANFAVVVDMKIFRQVNQVFALQESMGAPYALAGRMIARQVHEWQTAHGNAEDKVLFFCEDGTKHKGDLEEVFRRDRISLPHFIPKAVPSVQAADLLAWEVFHFACYDDDRRSLINLVKKRVSYSGIFKEKDLLDICEKTSVPRREIMSPNATVAFHHNKKRVRKRTIE